MIIAKTVKFLGKNGTDQDLEEAKKLFETGKIYAVYKVVIGDWQTQIYFPNYTTGFNSVMFEGVDFI